MVCISLASGVGKWSVSDIGLGNGLYWMWGWVKPKSDPTGVLLGI